VEITEHAQWPRRFGGRQVSLLLGHLAVGDDRENHVEKADTLLEIGSLRLENLQGGGHVDMMFTIGHRRDEPANLAWAKAEVPGNIGQPHLRRSIGRVAIEADECRREACQHPRAELPEMRDAGGNAAGPVGPDLVAQPRLEAVSEMVMMYVEAGQQNAIASQAEQLGLPSAAARALPI
jgi:hypothetical protein